MSRIEINCKNYQNFQLISSSTFKKIYKAQRKETEYNVAIREINIQKYSINEILKDIEIINNIKCENSISIKEKFYTKDYYYIITDYCEYNLEEYIRNRENPISIEEIQYILLQLNNILKIMNNKGIIHNNLKPKNILISHQRLNKSIIKLYYSYSKDKNNSTDTLDLSLTISPEIMNGEEDLSKSDLWSIGIIIYYIYFKKYPFNGINEFKLFKDIISKKKIEIIENEELNDLMNKLLKINVKERISWDEYFNHPFFKNEKDEIIIKLNEKINILDKELNEIQIQINYLLQQNINLNPFKNNFKTLSNHKDIIFHLDKLNDGRLISCSRDCILNIYKKNSYELQLSIKEHSIAIASFTELNNGKLITCSGDKTMKIIKLIGDNGYKIEQTLKEHNGGVCKIIEIKENELISVSYDKTMKIWKLNNENKFECFKTINFQSSGSNCNILKLNENEFVTSSFSDKNIKFWNLNDYSNISTINNIESIWTFKNMCLLDNDLLLIGGHFGFYLIQISTHQLIKNICESQSIFCIHKCLNGLLLCSIIDENRNNCLVKYQYENMDLNEVFQKENAHNDMIYSCVELNNGIIASGGRDKMIKLWKYY